MADGRLADRVVIVTGASRGIGKAIALACAHEGAAVAVTARTEAEWDPRLPGTVYDTVAEIEADGRAVGRDSRRPGAARRRRPHRGRGARRAGADRRAGEQRRGHGARPAAPARISAASRARSAGGPGGDRHRTGSAPRLGLVPRVPAQGVSPALRSRLVRELPPHAARAARHDRGRARRHREHQLVGRFHPRAKVPTSTLVDRARSHTAATRRRSTTSPRPSRSRWRHSGSR